jgi:hypothetical protein
MHHAQEMHMRVLLIAQYGRHSAALVTVIEREQQRPDWTDKRTERSWYAPGVTHSSPRCHHKNEIQTGCPS